MLMGDFAKTTNADGKFYKH